MVYFKIIAASRCRTIKPINEGDIQLAGNCCGRMVEIYEDGEFKTPQDTEPLICCTYRGRLGWLSITALSGNMFAGLKTYIAKTLQLKLIKDLFTDSLDLDTIQTDHDLLVHLYNKLTPLGRQDFLETNHDDVDITKSSLEKHICKCCCQAADGAEQCCLAYSENINKCIYIDCPGCCDVCTEHQIWEEEGIGKINHWCSVCKRDQSLKCPICFDETEKNQLCILSCHHAFCWKCFGKSVLNGHQIMKCPICRKDMIEIKIN